MNYVSSGYCITCRERADAKTGIVLPPISNVSDSPKNRRRLEPHRMLLGIACLFPGAAQLIGGDARTGRWFLLGAIVCLIGIFFTIGSGWEYFYIAVFFQLAHSSARKISMPIPGDASRSAAARRSIALSAALLISYLLLFNFFSLFFTSIIVTGPVSHSILNGDRILILSVRLANVRPGDWVSLYAPGLVNGRLGPMRMTIGEVMEHELTQPGRWLDLRRDPPNVLANPPAPGTDELLIRIFGNDQGRPGYAITTVNRIEGRLWFRYAPAARAGLL